MKKEYFRGIFASCTDVGKVRMLNEDSVKTMINSSGNVLLMVADGMGGHNKGEFASSEVVRIISEAFERKRGFINLYEASLWLKNIVRYSNSFIFRKQENDEDYANMGTTLIICLIFKNRLLILNCGDSRCYLLKNDELKQISEDQTYVNYLVKCGEITPEEALTHPKRHVLTNAIGLYPSATFDFKIRKYNGETILLCSDGLYNEVSKINMKNILLTDANPIEKCKQLISLANFNGGEDNSSVAIWESIND